MSDDSLYLNTHETALAVIATAMKKSRLRIDTLIINSLMGGVLFSSGGMLHVHVQGSPELYQDNPSIINLLQGMVYPIGLFYVVILGAELFNSNVLFFTTALLRGAVSIFDLIVNWIVSWWLNLVGNIFVCYVICNYSGVTQQELFVNSSIEIVVSKVECTFVETLLKGIAGNFYVSLAIYLQLMAKPLHVKFLMMMLPIFTFVTVGFTHSVADMFLLIIGLINGAPVSVGTVIWKTMLPGVIGNIIGGSFFGLLIWYSHIFVVERDREQLNLPRFEVRDEQPDLNMDSRVVRQKTNTSENFEDGYVEDEKFEETNETSNSSLSKRHYSPEQLFSNDYSSNNGLMRTNSGATGFSRMSNRTKPFNVRSPKNVFPVYGMGPPDQREEDIASGRRDTEEFEDDVSMYTATSKRRESVPRSADLIGAQLRRVVSRKMSNSSQVQRNDVEAQALASGRRPSSLISARSRSNPMAFQMTRSQSNLKNLSEESSDNHFNTEKDYSTKSSHSLVNRSPDHNVEILQGPTDAEKTNNKNNNSNDNNNDNNNNIKSDDTTLDDFSVDISEYRPNK